MPNHFNMQYFLSNSSTKSQVYPLMFGSQKIPVYCHMGNFGCGDGGWTLAMKIDGKKVGNLILSTFFADIIHVFKANPIFFLTLRKLFTTMPGFGATKMPSVFQEAKLGLTIKRPSCRPTGTHASPRSVSG